MKFFHSASNTTTDPPLSASVVRCKPWLRHDDGLTYMLRWACPGGKRDVYSANERRIIPGATVLPAITQKPSFPRRFKLGLQNWFSFSSAIFSRTHPGSYGQISELLGMRTLYCCFVV
jgi:hypothetical protein